MSDREKQHLRFFLKSEYPCVICSDRYGGTHSGAQWLAFIEYAIPEDALGDDLSCLQFFSDYRRPVGKGRSPSEALAHLKECARARLDDREDPDPPWERE